MSGYEAAVIIGAVIAAAGSGYAAYTSKQTADFNEDMAKREADYQKQKAAYEAKKHMEKVQRMMGEQRVGFASAGVSLMSASVSDVFGDTLEQAAIDSALIRAGGDIAANKSLIAAENYSLQGDAAVAGGVQGVGSSIMAVSGSMGKGGSGAGSGTAIQAHEASGPI